MPNKIYEWIICKNMYFEGVENIIIGYLKSNATHALMLWSDDMYFGRVLASKQSALLTSTHTMNAKMSVTARRILFLSFCFLGRSFSA